MVKCALVLTIILIPAVLVSTASASVEISGTSVTVPFFSPNGDGVQDVTGIRFEVQSDRDTVYIWVEVLDAAGDPVSTIAEADVRQPGTVNKIWDGTIASGQPAAEGQYTFKIVATAGGDSDSTNSAKVVLDTTSPTFATLIYPNPYTPGLPFADTLLVVEVTAAATQPDDWLSVWIVNEEPAETLCTSQLAGGDAVYTCYWDGRGRTDGVYEIVVSSWDRAGNSDEASYLIDLDKEGPWAAFTYPTKAYMTTFPDTVKGRVFDRNGIDSIGIRFYDNTEYLAVRTVPGGDTLSWHLAWPESLKIDDAFRLQVYAADSLGYKSTKSFNLTIDMTAPDVPSFHPLPEVVSDPEIEISGTSSSNDSVIVYLNDKIDSRIQCSAVGMFHRTIELQLGVNSIYGVSKDRAGNRSLPSELVTVTYSEQIGIFVPERLKDGSQIEINLPQEADLITLRVFSTDGYYISTTTIERPDLYSVLEPDLKDSDGSPMRNGPYLLAFEILYRDGTTTVEKFLAVVSR